MTLSVARSLQCRMTDERIANIMNIEIMDCDQILSITLEFSS